MIPKKIYREIVSLELFSDPRCQRSLFSRISRFPSLPPPTSNQRYRLQIKQVKGKINNLPTTLELATPEEDLSRRWNPRIVIRPLVTAKSLSMNTTRLSPTNPKQRSKLQLQTKPIEASRHCHDICLILNNTITRPAKTTSALPFLLSTISSLCSSNIKTEPLHKKTNKKKNKQDKAR